MGKDPFAFDETPSPTKKIVAGVIAGVVVVGGIFGWLFFSPKRGDTQTAACAILVDRTGSSVNDLTKDSYVKLASHMIDSCLAWHSSFSVYYFDNRDAKLQSASDKPFELWLPKMRRQKLAKEQVAKTQVNVLGAVESVFTTPPDASTGGHGSDIVTALSLASQSLQQQAAVEHVKDMYLVVLTDGYQTGELGMKKAFSTADSPVAPLLQQTKQLALVPQLAGVKVSFGGVGGGVASDTQQVPAWYEALVRTYWTKLVALGGGRMCVYNVEPTYLPGVC
jgi:hypothetical protein